MAFVSSTALAVRPFFSSPVVSARSNLPVARPQAAAARITMANVVPAFVQAMEDYKKDFPQFAARGLGATVKAERWNGRHAMFGLFTIVVTAYCKGHGLLPDASQLIDINEWGTLASLGDYTSISTQRAVILIAHIHVLMVSVAAAIAPFSFQDKLLLEPGETDETPAGLFPKFTPGMTKDAELWNSRFAMLGVICLVGQAIATKSDILDVANLWLGNLLF